MYRRRYVSQIEQLKGETTQTLRFKSKAEGDSWGSHKLDEQNYETTFGYFLPNLSTQFEVIFDDHSTITVVEWFE